MIGIEPDPFAPCPPPQPLALRRAKAIRTEEFYRVRREIALDEKAPAGDRLRAIEQIENRGLGRPKETIEHQAEESELERTLRSLTHEQRIEMMRARGVHLRAAGED